jgi:hypothetical protein
LRIRFRVGAPSQISFLYNPVFSRNCAPLGLDVNNGAHLTIFVSHYCL